MRCAQSTNSNIKAHCIKQAVGLTIIKVWDCHVRFCERLGVKLPWSTRLNEILLKNIEYLFKAKTNGTFYSIFYVLIFHSQKVTLMEIHNNHIQRLSFAKFLLEEGIKKSQLSNPLDSTAILNIHDCSDIYMQLLCEVYEKLPKKQNPSLIELINGLNPRLDELDKERINVSQFNRLNTARNKLKHETVFLNKIDIIGYCTEVRNFMIDSIPQHFKGLDFDSISLVHLIKIPQVKKHLEIAESHLLSESYAKALINISQAYGYLISEVTKFTSKNGEIIELKPSRWFESITQIYRIQGEKFDIQGFNKFEVGLKESFDYLNEILIITNLGIPLQEYIRFVNYRLFGYFNSNLEFTIIEDCPKQIDKHEVLFCFDFVLQIALK